MPRLLEGKRGIILGVANERSIAWGCAQACYEAGAMLAFNYLGDAQEKRVRKLTETLPGALVYPCDVSRDDEVEYFFRSVREHWETIDFVIHSLAYAQREDLMGDFLNTSRAGFALAMDISAYSLVAVARAASPMMSEGSSFVTMTYYGAEKVMPHYNVMGVAKAALETTVRYLAHELGPRGIRVNAVSPGAIKTLAGSAVPYLRTMLKIGEETAPLRKNASQQDVGKTAVYLVSDLASMVTGEVVHVDGGYHVMGMAADCDTAGGDVIGMP